MNESIRYGDERNNKSGESKWALNCREHIKQEIKQLEDLQVWKMMR